MFCNIEYFLLPELRCRCGIKGLMQGERRGRGMKKINVSPWFYLTYSTMSAPSFDHIPPHPTPPPTADQASADNARAVGAMAEKFAKQGWGFAIRQDKLTTISSTTSTVPRRSYSTLTPILHKNQVPPSLKIQTSSSHTSAGSVPIALMTGDVANFPPRLRDICSKLLDFMEEVVYPAERTLMDHQMSHDRWKPHPIVEDMKVKGSNYWWASGDIILPFTAQTKAKEKGLWNLFLPLETDPHSKFGAGLTNLEYSHLAEIMGRSVFASEVSKWKEGEGRSQ